VAPAAWAADEAEGTRAVTFDEAVKAAVAKNPTAQRALVEVRRTEALVHEARSASLPTLYGYGTYTLLDADRVFPATPSVSYPGVVDGTNQTVTVTPPPSAPRVIAAQNSINATVLLTVPIVSTRTWAQWSHAADGVDVQRMATADVQRLVAVGAARAYLAVVAQKRVLEVTVTARDTAKQHYDFAKARFDGGVGNRLDMARAEQEYLTDEAQVQNAELAVVKTREALGVAIGADAPVDSAAEPSLAQTPSLSDALDATKARTDVKTQELRAIAADHVRRDSWTDYMPLLTGVFQPFYQNPASLTTPLTGWQAQLILTVPFYDGGLRYGQKRERDALLAEAKFDYDGALRQARSDVRSAFEEVRRADEALKASTAASDVAKHALDLANKAYAAGATSNLELIDAERRARDAETQTAVAEDGARQARVDLLAASGRFP
jgi:outer membrane protein TolC